MDESGNIDFKAMMDSGIIPRRETTNSKAMQRTKQQKTAPVASAATEKKPLKLEDAVPADYTDPTKNPYFDPSMGVKIAPVSRRSRSLKFVQPGKYVNIGNEERAKQQLEKLKQEITESVKKAGMQTEFDVSDKVIKVSHYHNCLLHTMKLIDFFYLESCAACSRMVGCPIFTKQDI